MPWGGAADGDGMDRQPPPCAGARRPTAITGKENTAMPVADDDDYHEDDDMFGPLGPGERVISYNLPREQRPGGMKVRYKIKVISGTRANEIDARQAEAILEVPRWTRDHPDEQEQAGQDG